MAFCALPEVEVFRKDLITLRETYVGCVELPQFSNLCFHANAYDDRHRRIFQLNGYYQATWYSMLLGGCGVLPCLWGGVWRMESLDENVAEPNGDGELFL